jgi:hypothetical protein
MRIQQIARRIVRRLRHGTSLDRLIPPEIRNDGLYSAIVRVAATPGVRHMLEIGASGGDGSTEAFIEGALKNPSQPTLYSIEISDVRYQAFRRRHASRAFVRGYHASSVRIEEVASAEEVRHFYHSVKSPLNEYPLKTVLGWREQDVRYIREHGLDANGIKDVKNINGLNAFDVVLIDGSEFTGSAELDEVYGASYILLDDVRAFKNFGNFARLSADPAYVLVEVSEDVRNGYAVFQVAGSTGGSASMSIPHGPELDSQG